jgi:hypothetical protein
MQQQTRLLRGRRGTAGATTNGTYASQQRRRTGAWCPNGPSSDPRGGTGGRRSHSGHAATTAPRTPHIPLSTYAMKVTGFTAPWPKRGCTKAAFPQAQGSVCDLGLCHTMGMGNQHRGHPRHRGRLPPANRRHMHNATLQRQRRRLVGGRRAGLMTPSSRPAELRDPPPPLRLGPTIVTG